MKSPRFTLPIAIILTFGAACTDSTRYQSTMCALIDVSGTYASQKAEVVKTIKVGILPELLPGDSLFVLLIDSDSYDHGNLVAKLKTDRRPLEANAQKLSFAAELDELAASDVRSDLTDISGAMLLCADHLKSSEAGTKLMYVFSDMQEELPEGVTRSFGAQEFSNVSVAAINVIKLKGDNVEPAVYRHRLDEWKKRLLDAGASDWSVILDPAEIPQHISNHRQ